MRVTRFICKLMTCCIAVIVLSVSIPYVCMADTNKEKELGSEGKGDKVIIEDMEQTVASLFPVIVNAGQ